ncbi:MAG: thiolase family protein [Thermodesulfobacteriota bacterium]|nr:thiolase family protein [Thermodesulfobacteriota bacterium]
MGRRVAVVGISDMKVERRRPETFFELAFDAASEAMNDAGVAPKDVFQCFYATACENFNRHPLIFQTMVDTLGWVGKPLIVFSNAGGSSAGAISCAYSKILSGEVDIVLVIGGDKLSDADVPGRPGFWNLILYGTDSFFEQPFGASIGLGQMALVISHYKHTHNITDEQAAKVSVKNHGNALRNPNAQLPKKITVEDVLQSPVLSYPIKVLDCSLVSDMFSALVLASEDVAKKLSSTPIWLDGYGYANHAAKLGWRQVLNQTTELHDFYCVSESSKQAYKMAGINNPLKEIDVAEIQDGYSWFELMEYEDLGFCGDGEGGKFIDSGITQFDGDLPVNPSGGCIGHGHAYGGAATLAVAEIVKQLRGDCGDYQVKGRPETGLALSMGGSGLNVCSVQILRR